MSRLRSSTLPGSHIQPSLQLLDSDEVVVLDNLAHTTSWVMVELQLGPRRGQMDLVLNRPANQPYDGGVAVDDVSFVDCHMPRPTQGECPQEKPFQCDNKVCIEFQQVCDVTDDCGDNSDEKENYCTTAGYTRVDFEDDNHPFGIFHSEGETSLGWERGAGMTPSPHTGPSFDHTTWRLAGHYLYLNSAAGAGAGATAAIVSETFSRSSEDGPDCEMTLNYHMYGAGLGTLKVRGGYLQ